MIIKEYYKLILKDRLNLLEKQDSSDKTVPYDPTTDDGLRGEEKYTSQQRMQRPTDLLRPMEEVGLGDAPPIVFKPDGPSYSRKEANDMRRWVSIRNNENQKDYNRQLSIAHAPGYHGADRETLIKGSLADTSVMSQLDPKRRTSFEYPSDILKDPIGIKRITQAMNPDPQREIQMSDVESEINPIRSKLRDPLGIRDPLRIGRSEWRDAENYRRKEYYATKNNTDAITLPPSEFATKYGLRQPAKTEQQMIDKIKRQNDQVWDDYENYEKQRAEFDQKNKMNEV